MFILNKNLSINSTYLSNLHEQKCSKLMTMITIVMHHHTCLQCLDVCIVLARSCKFERDYEQEKKSGKKEGRDAEQTEREGGREMECRL